MINYKLWLTWFGRLWWISTMLFGGNPPNKLIFTKSKKMVENHHEFWYLKNPSFWWASTVFLDFLKNPIFRWFSTIFLDSSKIRLKWWVSTMISMELCNYGGIPPQNTCFSKKYHILGSFLPKILNKNMPKNGGFPPKFRNYRKSMKMVCFHRNHHKFGFFKNR